MNPKWRLLLIMIGWTKQDYQIGFFYVDRCTFIINSKKGILKSQQVLIEVTKKRGFNAFLERIKLNVEYITKILY